MCSLMQVGVGRALGLLRASFGEGGVCKVDANDEGPSMSSAFLQGDG